jgi:hypothetical protein
VIEDARHIRPSDWCSRGKTSNLSAQKYNSNTFGFNLKRHSVHYILLTAEDGDTKSSLYK